MDFSAPSLDFSFPVGTGTTACIDITITDDNNLEGDHTFTVDLLNIQIIGDDLRRMVSMIGIGSPSSTTVTIQDPEGMLSVPSRIDLLCIADIQISKQEVCHTILLCGLVILY